MFKQVICVIVILIVVYILTVDKTISQQRVNGYPYEVMRGAVSEGAALQRLVFLRETAFLVAIELKRKSITEDIGRRLEKRMQTCILSERGPPLSPYIASTVDKGTIIYICIRDHSTKELLSEQHGLYVFLHELAHVVTYSVGHTPEFYENMSNIVEACTSLGKLSRNMVPMMYCGEHISF